MRRKIAVLCLMLFIATAAHAATSKKARTPKASLNLGDTNADLVYTPLNPCRIIDTRTAGGILTGGSTRKFFVSGIDGFLTQGGTDGGCGVPSGATSVLINFVAVTPDAIGNLKGAAYPNPIPTTGSILNYQVLMPNLNIANAVAFPICDPAANTCSFDITLFTNGGGTHVVADVLGYFKRFPKEQTIMSVGAGTGLTGGGSSGDITLEIDTKDAKEGQMLAFNGSGIIWTTPPQGTITGVTAGSGLTGGGTSGSVSVAADFTPSAGNNGLNGTGTTVARGDHAHYARTVIVSPAATSTVSGTALLNAMNSIATASATNTFLLKIEPGIYDIGTSSLQLKDYVDVEGSGEDVTKITHSFGSDIAATILSANNCEVRQLTLESTGGNSSAAAVNAPTGFRARQVMILTSGATTINVGVVASLASASLTMTDCTIIVSGAQSQGINSTKSTTLDRVSISSTSSPLSNNAYGLFLSNGSSAIVRNSSITATTGNQASIGIEMSNAQVQVMNTLVTAQGGTGSAFGLDASFAAVPRTITIEGSRITAATNTVRLNGANYTVRIGATRLEGGPVSGATVTCAQVWDENFVASTSTCP